MVRRIHSIFAVYITTFKNNYNVVEGVVEMMLDATEKYKDPITKDRMCGWHAALFPTGRSGMYKITVGDWRGKGCVFG